jgi:hypothetical protein
MRRSEERVFASRVPVKYVLHPASERPDVLLVAFSAAHEPDDHPRYYRHRALRELPCHRLFVLDDHGPREPLPRPAWYLGRHRRSDVPDSVCELIERMREELAVERGRLVTGGLSMGGWAALYFGARVGAGHAIAGEPQTLLGRHLCQEENRSIAEHVAGGSSQADSDYLDALLFDALRAAAAPPRVHVYSGRGSPYYDRDVRPLLALLDELDVPWELELGDHSAHVPDLGLHFPAYMVGRVEDLLADLEVPAR